MSEARPRVLIDCDPGHDDAIAILLAVRHLDVVAITTVAGNQSLEKVTTNALAVLALAGVSGIPVASGRATPLAGPPRYAGNVHGESGLDGADLPPPHDRPDHRDGVALIAETVHSGRAGTIIATGPLTNLASALETLPELRHEVREISLMGGSFGPGNVTAAAEFNVAFDPEAAAAVFASGVPIRMCGLNLTRQAAAGDAEIARFRSLGNRAGEVVAELVTFYRDRVRELRGRDAVPLHDACAVAALIDPTLIRFEPMQVAVELRGEHTRGMTVCDGRFIGLGSHRQGGDENVLVGMEIDRERFFALLYDTIRSF